MNEGDPVEILVQGDHIILEKFRPRCIFCSSDQQVGEFKAGIFVLPVWRKFKKCNECNDLHKIAR